MRRTGTYTAHVSEPASVGDVDERVAGDVWACEQGCGETEQAKLELDRRDAGRRRVARASTTLAWSSGGSTRSTKTRLSERVKLETGADAAWIARVLDPSGREKQVKFQFQVGVQVVSW